MTYYSGEIPQPSGMAQFDGVALLNAAQPLGAMQLGAMQLGAMTSGVLPAGFQPGMPPGQMFGAGQPLPAAMGQSNGGQPSTEALRQQAAAVTQHCYRWLEAVVPVVPQVSSLVPAMIAAVQQYETQQYAGCLNQAVAVAEMIRQLQAAVPGLPAL